MGLPESGFTTEPNERPSGWAGSRQQAAISAVFTGQHHCARGGIHLPEHRRLSCLHTGKSPISKARSLSMIPVGVHAGGGACGNT